MNMALSSRGAFGNSSEAGGGNPLSAWVTANDAFGVGSTKSHANTQQYRPPSSASRFPNFSDDMMGSSSLLSDDAPSAGAFPFRSANNNQFDSAKSGSNNAQQRSLANAMLMNAATNSSLSQPLANSSISQFPSATSAFGSYVPYGNNSPSAIMGGSRLSGTSSSTNGGTPPPTQALQSQNSQLTQLALSNAARAASASQQNGSVSSSSSLFGGASSRSAAGGQNGAASWMLAGSGSGSTALHGGTQSLSQSQATHGSQSSALFRAASALMQAGSSTPTSSANMQMIFNQMMLMNSGNPSSGDGTTSIKEAPPALLDPSNFPSLAASRSTPPLPLVNGPTPTTAFSASQPVATSLPLAAFGGNVAVPSANAGPVGSARTYVSAALGTRSGAGDGHTAAQEFSIQPDDFPALPATISRSTNAGVSNSGVPSSASSVSVAQLSAAFSSSMQFGGVPTSSNVFPSTGSFASEMARSNHSLGPNAAGSLQMNNSVMQNAANSMRGATGTVRPPGSAPSDGSVQLPASIIPDHFGMLGILSFLKAAEQDQEAVQLASGIDLTSLGVNVTASDPLFVTFASPWSDAPAKPQDIDCHVPTEYITSPFMRDKFPTPSMVRYSDEQLFFIFYVMIGDAHQLLAAAELHSRDWRFHKEERVWITRIPTIDPAQKTSTGERGSYYYFDVSKWTRGVKEMVIEYEKLEEKPQLVQPGAQHTMMTAAASLAANVPHKLASSGNAPLSQSHGAQTSLANSGLNVPGAIVSQHFAGVGGSQAAAGISQSQQSTAQFGNMSALAALKQPHAVLGSNLNLPGGLSSAANGMFNVPSLN